MKKITITIASIALIAFACKKDSSNKQKCYWDIVINNRTQSGYLDKPSSDQIKKIQDTCSCSVTVKENCYSCDLNVTTQGGQDVPCR